jgi:hypothetical protein
VLKRSFILLSPGFVLHTACPYLYLCPHFQVLEQVEGGDLIVNKGNESKPKEASSTRDINAVEGFDQALGLAQVRLSPFPAPMTKLSIG